MGIKLSAPGLADLEWSTLRAGNGESFGEKAKDGEDDEMQ